MMKLLPFPCKRHFGNERFDNTVTALLKSGRNADINLDKSAITAFEQYFCPAHMPLFGSRETLYDRVTKSKFVYTTAYSAMTITTKCDGRVTDLLSGGKTLIKSAPGNTPIPAAS